MTGSGMAYVIGALAVAWVLQLWLSLLQIRRFYRRMAELKKYGRASVGLEGGTYKGRVYTILVLDDDNKIIHAEKLSGITVFANLKPVPELIGYPVESLINDDLKLSIPKKIMASFRKAAEGFFTKTDEPQNLPGTP